MNKHTHIHTNIYVQIHIDIYITHTQTHQNICTNTQTHIYNTHIYLYVSKSLTDNSNQFMFSCKFRISVGQFSDVAKSIICFVLYLNIVKFNV